MNTEKQDIYQRVTDTIVKAIEEGAGSYRMPWRTSGEFPQSPINAISRKPYRGINVILLWATAQAKGYQSGIWATYKQWQELGAQVRKGEKASHVVFWKFFDVDAESQNGEEESASGRRIPMARDYFVFNADQVDGYKRPEEAPTTVTERIAAAEAFFSAVGIVVRPGGNRAYYNPNSDTIHMPPFEAFPVTLDYYSVLSHETTHWTASPKRLNRDLSGRFGTESYAMEELIAELGAAFICSQLGLPTDPRTDHAPYIASWLQALKNDKRAIFTAAAKAQEALDWMNERARIEEAA
jgi:antirestriction protein ArdC